MTSLLVPAWAAWINNAEKIAKDNGDVVGGKDLRAGAGDHQNVHFIYLPIASIHYFWATKNNGTTGRMLAVSGYDKTENKQFEHRWHGNKQFRPRTATLSNPPVTTHRGYTSISASL
jgi:hypothetical protein